MSRLNLNNYFNNLQDQIYSSVDRIKLKQSSSDRANFAETSTEEYRYYYNRIENYAYQLLPENISWTLQTSGSPSLSENLYATTSYQQVRDALKEPTVLIDFMFKNNREFDLKV